MIVGRLGEAALAAKDQGTAGATTREEAQVPEAPHIGVMPGLYRSRLAALE